MSAATNDDTELVTACTECGADLGEPAEADTLASYCARCARYVDDGDEYDRFHDR